MIVNEKIVYMIIDKTTNESVGVYSGAYEYEFDSKDAALNANCDGIHKDTNKYEIGKFKVTYERIE